MRLNRAMLYVKDFPGMVSYYAEILRARPVAETLTENWAEFETGGALFALHAIPEAIAVAIAPREETPIKLMFEVEDLAHERERLEALGANVLPRPWAAFDVIDPEGNIFQVYSLAR
jgi:catechol-2,3-dioxygenase